MSKRRHTHPVLHRDGSRTRWNPSMAIIKAGRVDLEDTAEVDGGQHPATPLPVGAHPFLVPEYVDQDRVWVAAEPVALGAGPQYQQHLNQLDAEEDIDAYRQRRLAELEDQLTAYQQERMAEFEAQMAAAEAQLDALTVQREAMLAEFQTQGQEAGYEAGREAALAEHAAHIQEAQAQAADMLTQAARVLDSVTTRQDKLLESLSSDMAACVRLVLQRLLGEAWRLFPDMLLSQCVQEARQALAQHTRGGRLTLLLSSDVETPLRVQSPEALAALSQWADVQVDPDLEPGQVFLRVRPVDQDSLLTGSLWDISLEQQIEMLLHVVQEHWKVSVGSGEGVS